MKDGLTKNVKRVYKMTVLIRRLLIEILSDYVRQKLEF